MKQISKWINCLAIRSELQNRNIILRALDYNPEATVLDLGCADGEFTERAINIISTNKALGVEIVEDAVAMAIQRGIEVHRTDLNQILPFPEERFDVVIASHVIEHLYDTDMFIREVYRVLKKGGYLVMATPNLASWLSIIYLLLGKQPNIAEVSDQALVGTWSLRGKYVSRNGPAHRRLFTHGAIKGLLQYYGFSVEQLIGSGFLLLPTPLERFLCSIDRRHSTDIVIKARK
jgi:methionine biosynthesis protein MetW